MSKESIAGIIAKLKAGNYAIEELSEQELSDFTKELEELDEVSYVRVYNELYAIMVGRSAAGLASGRIDPAFRAALETRLDAATPEAPVISLRNTGFRARWAAAAVVFLLLSAGGLYWFAKNRMVRPATVPPIPVVLHIPSANDIPPGGDRALLTLADGSTIALDSARKGELTSQGNTRVMKLGNGQLAYRTSPADALPPGAAQRPPWYNTVSTPRGGQYPLTLSDGTKVWLNTASSIRFPVIFTGRERTVEISGEAYLEVSENKDRPFHVLVKGMKIDVLGTHFNVMAYEDENNINTTLLEGSVKISAGSGSEMLRPGQQARLNKVSENIKITEANTDEAIAWKEGRFEFDGEDIGAIMRNLSRWYDVDIDFEGKRPSASHFSGSISRNVNVSQVLRILELGGARFRIEGKKIIVLQ